MKGTTFITTGGKGGNKNFTALNVPRQWPLVILMKVGWQNGKAFRRERGGVLELQQRREFERFG